MASEITETKITDSERQMKLFLYVKEHAPITLEEIHRGLWEYRIPEDGDEKARSAARRRFIRDRESLESYGLFISCDDNNQYFINRQASYSLPVDITDGEGSILRQVCCSLLEDDTYPNKEDLLAVLVKLSDVLDAPDILSFQGEGTSDNPMTASITKIRKAIETRKLLSFSYEDAKGNKTTRKVEAFGAFTLESHFFMVAYDPEKEGERVFRLDRMKKIRVNPSKPNNPDFDPHPFEENLWIRLPFQLGRAQATAQLRIEESALWRIRKLSREQGEFQEQEDGSFLWEVDYSDPGSLAGWCIQHGPGITIQSPQEALDAYEKGLQTIIQTCGEEGDCHE